MDKHSLAMDTDEKRLEEIADQLRCPFGEEGIKMGELLSDTNAGMIDQSIEALQLTNKNRILELGHGNGAHLNNVLNRKVDLRYFGMEISDVMVMEAERINSEYVGKRRALFQLYDGKAIPYVQNFFDRIFSVNTIYFWDRPVAFLNELHRVLKPRGTCVITFAKRESMEKLPFVTHNDFFCLYDNDELKKLVKKTAFELKEIKDRTERIKSKSGDWVTRNYSIAVLCKKRGVAHPYNFYGK